MANLKLEKPIHEHTNREWMQIWRDARLKFFASLGWHPTKIAREAGISRQAAREFLKKHKGKEGDNV